MSNFKFDFSKVEEKTIEFTTKDQQFLLDITRRMAGVTAQGASERCISVTVEVAEREVVRLQAIFDSIKKEMSEEEFAEYEAVMAAHAPKEASAEEQAALVKKLDLNKDRASH